MAKKLSKFQQQCINVSEETGIGVTLYHDERGEKDDAFEDDGTLHIRKRGIRACFNVVASSSLEQNDDTREIMGLLRLEVSDSVLADETDDHRNPPQASPF